MSELRGLMEKMAEAPESELDPLGVAQIKAMDYDDPDPVELLKLLDDCAYYAWASGFVIMILGIMVEVAAKTRNMSMDTVTKLAREGVVR